MDRRDDSFLALQVTRLKSLYRKFGTKGLKDCSQAEVRLLLSAKQLELGQLSRKIGGQQATEHEIALKSEMQLEIQDLKSLVKGRTRDQAWTVAAGASRSQRATIRPNVASAQCPASWYARSSWRGTRRSGHLDMAGTYVKDASLSR